MYDEEEDYTDDTDDTEEEVVRPIDKIRMLLSEQGYQRWAEITAQNYPMLARWGVTVLASFPTIQSYITYTFRLNLVDIFYGSEQQIRDARSVDDVERIFIQNASLIRPIRL